MQEVVAGKQQRCALPNPDSAQRIDGVESVEMLRDIKYNKMLSTELNLNQRTSHQCRCIAPTMDDSSSSL